MSSNIDYPYMDDIIVVFVTNILFFATIIVYLTTYTKNHVKPLKEHCFFK
jgi:CRISPR/Cas system-associated protein Cas7 (RAMP superfamily)